MALVQESIQEELTCKEAEESVRIIFAIESGSLLVFLEGRS